MAERQSVLIIGGGIIGIACAHYLVEADYDVTIVEAGDMAAACSHGNCGYICPSHALPLAAPGALREGVASLFQPKSAFRIKPRVEAGFIKWMWQFARHCTTSIMLSNGRGLHGFLQSSMEEYRQLLDGNIPEAEWKQTGLLYAFESAKGMDGFARTARLLEREFGVPSQQMDGEALASFDASLKPGLAGGFHFPDDASVRPDGLTKGWIQLIKDKGVTILENTPVDGIERRGNHITAIAAGDEQISADHYVLATGAISGALAELIGEYLPIEPGKGYSITMERPEYSPELPMLFPEHHVGLSPFETGFRAGSMMEFVGFDSSIPAFRTAQLRDAAAHYLQGDLPPTNIEQWYGWRPMTWDSLPIIGKFDGLTNLCCATGHNMLGMSLAPATGRLVAEIISGDAPHIDPAPFSPMRF